jgi:hypothetical protein
MLWYATTAGFLGGDMMSMFLMTGESLSPVNYSAIPGWLELPAPWVGLPELLGVY